MTATSVPTTTSIPETKIIQRESNVQVKAEFILSEPHPTLSTANAQVSEGSNNRAAKNEDGSHMNQKQRQNRHKKNRKKRCRDASSGSLNKICRSVIDGRTCIYGDKCSYTHDIKEILRLRQDDVKEIEDGCPIYNLRGHCPYGISCRVGSSHLNLTTGVNLKKDESELASPPPPQTMNFISRDAQKKLRNKTYKFICKQYFEEKGYKKGGNRKGRSDEKETEAKTADTSVTEKNPDDVEPATTEQDGTQINGQVEKPEEAINKSPSSTTEIVTPAVSTDTNTVTATTTTTTNTNAETTVDLSPYPLKTRKLIDFSNKVYVAPLTTVGNLPFRRILKRYGADITCGEMAVAKNLLEGKNSEWALLKRHPEEDVFGVQIASGHADMYTRISEVIENEGLNIDFMDLNLGCPIDIICNHGAGAKLMLRDKKLKESLEGMTKVLSCPVTIKVRTGWDENKPFAHKLVPKIQSWGIEGISAVMIHGRSRLQRYHKLADWNYIKKVVDSQDSNLPAIPIIGNGDIFSYTDYEQNVLKNEGLNTTAMLGRGALVKPWLPTEIKERRHWDISASERLDILKNFVRYGLEHWGSDQQGLDTTRRFLLEWLSFLYRYIPVGLLEVLPQNMNQRPPSHMCGRNDLETLMLSKNCADWIKISEMLLGPVPEGFHFEPKHKANAYK